MAVLASLNDQVGTLVHPDARASPQAFARHKAFIVSRLALSFGALLSVPPCLLLGNAPAGWQAVALAWLVLPLAAVAWVSRTGRPWAGEVSSHGVWIGLGVTVAMGSGSAAGFALLLVPLLEAAVGGASPRDSGRVTTAVLIAAAVLGMALLWRLGPPRSVDARFDIAILGAALGYAALLVRLALPAGEARRGAEDVAREHLRLRSDLSEDLFVALDATGGVVDIGPECARVLGLAPSELIGRGLFERLNVADRPLFLKLVAAAAAGDAGVAGTLRLRTGRSVEAEDRAMRLPVYATVEFQARRRDGATPPDPARRRGLAVGLIRDVSKTSALEQAIDEAHALALRSNAGRDLFLANVSHELRTPLNAIIGFSEMLSSDELMPRDLAKQREYATIIHQSGQHLLSVVNTILDASKIEAGTFAIFPEAFDMATLIQLCCDMMRLKAEQAGIRLEQDLRLGSDEVVADKRACKQIVLNLLSNALKFTPRQGRVTVGAIPDGTSVLIFVADTGIGIGPGDLPRLGSPFFQVRDGYDRDRDGTGLGLSVVRGLVGLHGGTIAIESAPGQGTRVTARLPRDCRRSAAVPASVTRIETFARYSSRTDAGRAGESDRIYDLA